MTALSHEPRVKYRCCFIRRNLGLAIIYVGGLIACLMAGTLYGYALISPQLKTLLGYSQTQANLVGTIGDVGLYLAFIPGFVFDYTNPTFTMALGGSFLALGYILTSLATRDIITEHSWGLLAFFLFVVGQGSFYAFTAGYAPAVRAFPKKYRNIIMGSMVASFAASSFMFSFVYKSIDRDLNLYLVLLGAVTGGVCLLISPFMIRIDPPREEMRTGIPTDSESSDSQLIDSIVNDAVNKDTSPLVSASSFESMKKNSFEVEFPFYRMMLTLDFWLLFLLFFMYCACGLLWINVQGNIAVSLGFPDGTGSNLVIALSCGNIAGRLVWGFGSDLTQNKFSRVWWLVLSGAIFTVTHFVFAFYQRQMMYAAAVLSGICYGAGFSIVLSMVSLLFGTKHIGSNVGFVSLAPAAAGLSYGSINGVLYHAHAHLENGVWKCTGELCFRNSFILTGASAAVGTIISIILALRTPNNRLRSLGLGERILPASWK